MYCFSCETFVFTVYSTNLSVLNIMFTYLTKIFITDIAYINNYTASLCKLYRKYSDTGSGMLKICPGLTPLPLERG